MPDELARPGFDEAIAIVSREAPEPSPASVPLAEALGRVTAAEARAADDYPRFDVSAMDGFAFASSRCEGASPSAPVVLRIGGDGRAGRMPPAAGATEAYRISTGAPIPAGCDTVVARELARRDGDALMLTSPAAPGRNIRRRGEDATRGDRVLGPGHVLSPEVIGALGCYGIGEVVVARPPTLAILSTGDELLADPGSAVFDANGAMIAAMAQALGLAAVRYPAIADDPAQLANSLARVMSSDVDIVVSTGGVSAGDHDHLPAVVRAAGATVHFHGVSMRPGKPVLFATLPNGALYFGLPGNPVAAALGFRFLVAAAIRKTLGLGIERGTIVSTEAVARPGATLLLKARFEGHDDQCRITILPDQRSHTMRPLIDANCWVAVDLNADGSARHRRYALAPLGRQA